MRKLSLFFLLTLWIAATSLRAENEAIDTLKTKELEEVLVSAVRVRQHSPVAHSNVSGKILQKENAASNLPVLLQNMPSLVAFTEGGTGVGNTALRIRGTDATRINVTLNGMPLNNPESQEVYWVNLPDISNSLNNIQLQRGVGTSTNGAGAFGASLSMSTAGGQTQPYAESSTAVGSYGTISTSVAAGTGIFENGLSLDARYSRVLSDGYIRNGSVNHQNIYAALSHYTDEQLLRLIYMRGEQHTGITWEGVTPEQMLDAEYGRRYNPAGEYYDAAGKRHYYDNETDNYYSDIVQLLFTRKLNSALSLNANLSYNHGFGYYENYKTGRKFSSFGLENQNIDGTLYSKSDMVRQKLLKNGFTVGNVTLNYQKESLRIDAGAMMSRFDGSHYGKLPWIMWWEQDNTIDLDSFEWYRNRGIKSEASAFAKAEYAVTGKLTTYLDLQGRFVNYSLRGTDDDLAEMDELYEYRFFNPKAGLFYRPDNKNSLYASVAVANREPLRADLKDSKKWGAKTDILPERMFDFEAGYRYQTSNFLFSTNFYHMQYDNQMVQTGRLNETGYRLNENVKNSFRQGVELESSYLFADNKWRVDGNLTLSRNKIKDYTAWYDVYDENWSVIGQQSETMKNTTISYSPSAVGMLALGWQPLRDLHFNLNGKYVGKQYLDNTQNDERSLSGYFVSNFSTGYTFRLARAGEIGLQLFVNNLLNNAYASQSIMRDTQGNEISSSYIGYYPQAMRNVMVKVTVKAF